MNWQQFQAILWLRWRLTKNQFARAGQLNAVLSVFMLVILLLGAVAATVGGVVGGMFAGLRAPPEILLVIWDAAVFAFLIFWLSGLMIEIQRSESIDLTKLLHLPVTLQQVFVINYLASHFTPSIVLLLPAMLGLCAGLIVGAGPAMALQVPLVLSFIFMVTAWTYCLRGWLAALMINKRRRRTIIVWVTIVFVLICQLPNIVFNSSFFRTRIQPKQGERQKPGRGREASNRGQGGLVVPESVMQAHLVLPPGWVGYGAMALKERNAWPALGAMAASGLLGALGLMRAYRLTIRFYQGAEGRTKPKPARPVAPGRRGVLLVERRLPWLSDDTAALTLATFRSLLRAPELKMAFAMPLVMGVVLVSMRFTRSGHLPSGSWTAFAATAAAVVAVFSIAPTMSNVFGLDRNGFCALVLLPTRRHRILLAKNLAFSPFVALVALIMLIVVKFLLRLPWEAFLAGLLQACVAFLLFSLVGNLLSILAPFRIAPGTLKAKKPKAIVFVAVFVTLLCLPLVMLPMLIPAGLRLLFSGLDWVPWLPVNLLATLGLLAVVGGLYSLLLPLEGRLLERREQIILREVTEEVE